MNGFSSGGLGRADGWRDAYRASVTLLSGLATARSPRPVNALAATVPGRSLSQVEDAAGLPTPRIELLGEVQLAYLGEWVTT